MSFCTHTTLLDVFRANPEAARPLIAYHDVLLRGPSPLTIGERELIAAYVSGLNACVYCHGIHAATAEAFSVAPGLLESLMADVDSAGIDDRLKPVFRFVRKLTLTPSRIVDTDRAAIVAAGWPPAALHDIAAICGLFNLMNRIVEGLGVTLDGTYAATSARRLHDVGYVGLLDLL